MQGGVLFLETEAMEKFSCCFDSYLHSVTNILVSKEPFDEDVEKTEQNVEMTRVNDSYGSDDVEESLQSQLETAGQHMQALTINVSQLSTVLVFANKQGLLDISVYISVVLATTMTILYDFFTFAGGVQELVLEFDVHLNLESANMTRNIAFDLKRLSFISRVLQQRSGHAFQLPHFYSFTSDKVLVQLESGDGPAEIQPMGIIHSLKDPSSSRDSDSLGKVSAKNSVPEVFDLISQKPILEHLRAFLSAQNRISGQTWVGNGSTSGFDIILSLTEIEVSFDV